MRADAPNARAPNGPSAHASGAAARAQAFKLFDDDDTGRISLKNMKRVARELGEELADDEMMAMIEEFDRDQDGEINEQEFAYIMKQTSIY